MAPGSLIASVLLLYGTSEGQTGPSSSAADVVEATGHDVAVLNAKHLTDGFALTDRAIVGGSIHRGSHQTAIMGFVRDQVGQLDAMPSAFFSLGLSAAGGGEGQAAEDLVGEFLDETDFALDRTLSVVGALKYSEYGLLTKDFAH